jgi:hypothetical protein
VKRGNTLTLTTTLETRRLSGAFCSDPRCTESHWLEMSLNTLLCFLGVLGGDDDEDAVEDTRAAVVTGCTRGGVARPWCGGSGSCSVDFDSPTRKLFFAPTLSVC